MIKDVGLNKKAPSALLMSVSIDARFRYTVGTDVTFFHAAVD